MQEATEDLQVEEGEVPRQVSTKKHEVYSKPGVLARARRGSLGGRGGGGQEAATGVVVGRGGGSGLGAARGLFFGGPYSVWSGLAPHHDAAASKK